MPRKCRKHDDSPAPPLSGRVFDNPNEAFSPYARRVQLEGWDLFTRSDGRMEIEAINDVRELEQILHVRKGTITGTNDVAVINDLAARALEGDRLALLALYLDGTPSDKSVYLPPSLCDIPPKGA